MSGFREEWVDPFCTYEIEVGRFTVALEASGRRPQNDTVDEPTPEPAESAQKPREIVRRFDSMKNVRRARKKGIAFDATKGYGIPATTTNIDPINPDRIKDATGARNADAWMDINITGKDVLHRLTKSGRKEIVIRQHVEIEDIIRSGRTARHAGDDSI